MNLNQIFEAYTAWMRKQSPWRWSPDGSKLINPPIMSIVCYLSRIGAKLEAVTNEGTERHDARSSRIAIGFALMQIYLIWSQHRAHKGVSFGSFIEIMEKPIRVWENPSDLSRYRACQRLIRHIVRHPKMRDRFGLIFVFWPLRGLDMGICVREAWATVRASEAPPEPIFIARRPNMIQ